MEETLGKRIATCRKRMGLTQDSLAERLGITAQAVSKWENDQSCPDITMLPKLAQIFGITTDELLGMPAQEKVYEAEVIPSAADSGQSGDDVGKHGVQAEFELQWDGGRKNGIGFALWIVLVGGLLMASKLLDWGVGLWEILWPSALLVFGVFGMLPNHFTFFHLGCALFGGYFLLDNLNILPFRLGGELMLPVVIILFGLSLLVDSMRKKKKPHVHISRNGGHRARNSTCEQEGESFSCSTSFGQDDHYIALPRLSRGSAEVSFGELTIDLSGCETICAGCRLDLDCAFGELRLLVPKQYRLEPDISTAFATVDVRGNPAPDAIATIYADCDVSFGEITLQYI